MGKLHHFVTATSKVSGEHAALASKSPPPLPPAPPLGAGIGQTAPVQMVARECRLPYQSHRSEMPALMTPLARATLAKRTQQILHSATAICSLAAVQTKILKTLGPCMRCLPPAPAPAPAPAPPPAPPLPLHAHGVAMATWSLPALLVGCKRHLPWEMPWQSAWSWEMLARLSPVKLEMIRAPCVHLLHHLLPQQMVKRLMMLQLVAIQVPLALLLLPAAAAPVPAPAPPLAAAAPPAPPLHAAGVATSTWPLPAMLLE